MDRAGQEDGVGETKGFYIRLRAPWDDVEPMYVASKTRGGAVSLVVQTMREHVAREIGYQHIASAIRYTPLDGKRDGFHERPSRRLAGGVVA